MGIRLVGAALSANWSHLSERARLVLAQMCYIAMTDQKHQQGRGF